MKKAEKTSTVSRKNRPIMNSVRNVLLPKGLACCKVVAYKMEQNVI